MERPQRVSRPEPPGSLLTRIIHPLPDGSLSLDAVRAQRIAKVAEMASRLVEAGAYVDHSDSIMTLVSFGYSPFEVHALLTDARQVAVEHVVAMEMSEGTHAP